MQSILPLIHKEDKSAEVQTLKKINSNIFDISDLLQNKKINFSKHKKNQSESELAMSRISPKLESSINFKKYEKNFITNIKLAEIKDKNKLSLPYSYFTPKMKSYSCKTQAGINVNGEKKTNQDSYFTKSRIFGQNDFHIMGVLDGHGKIG